MNRFKLGFFLGEKRKEGETIFVDNSMIPRDILLLNNFIGDTLSFDNKNIVINAKKEIDDPKKEYAQGDIMSVTKVENDKVEIAYDIFDDDKPLTLPKSEFLCLLDELAAAIDTGKDIWIEKSDEGKYRIWGE